MSARAAAVQAEVQRTNREVPGVKMIVLQDNSLFIERAINNVQEHAVVGGLLVVLIIFAFLRDFRSTLIVCTSNDHMKLEVTMRARELNPDLRIVVRVWDDQFAGQIRRFMNVTNDQIKEVFVYVSAMVFETVCAFAMLIVYRQKYELYKSSIDPKS